jgi:hypothetical protein
MGYRQMTTGRPIRENILRWIKHTLSACSLLLSITNEQSHPLVIDNFIH